MVAGHWQLADDEALVVRTWPSTANYQGIALGHHWWESLDYANRRASDRPLLGGDGDQDEAVGGGFDVRRMRPTGVIEANARVGCVAGNGDQEFAECFADGGAPVFRHAGCAGHASSA